MIMEDKKEMEVIHWMLINLTLITHTVSAYNSTRHWKSLAATMT